MHYIKSNAILCKKLHNENTLHTVYRETFKEENFRKTGGIENFTEKTFVGQWPVDGAHAHAPQNSQRKLSRMVPNPQNS